MDIWTDISLTLPSSSSSSSSSSTAQFDGVFGPRSSLSSLFNTCVTPSIQSLFNPSLSTLVINLGSGDAMYGKMEPEGLEDVGIIPRACMHVMANLDDHAAMTVGMKRIEEGGVRDLLGGIKEVREPKEVQGVIEMGRRRTGDERGFTGEEGRGVKQQLKVPAA